MELLPCPFCGSTDLVQTHFGISCRGCHVEVCATGLERDAAAWNRRALKASGRAPTNKEE